MWKRKLINIARRIDDTLDDLSYKLQQRLCVGNPVHIVAYRTYGTPYKIYIRGRVLEDKKIASAEDQHSTWDNLLNMYKRFESDEVPGAEIKLAFEGVEHIVTADKEGFFVFDMHPEEPVITDDLYHTLELELLGFGPGIKELAEIMIPPPDAEYGIISDIDDTIIRTNATSLLAMGKTVLTSNAKTRLPYAGVSEFYKTLQLGRNGKRNNPFFYVSSSPWNLYDLLVDFMDHNEIPEGPLLLRDFGLQSDSFINNDYLSHKLTEITRIFETYPHLNFVLVGDSGEHDPEIYLEVVKKFKDRVLAVYIRDVSISKHKIAIDVAKKLKELNVEMILTSDTLEAARHAAATGLIFTGKIPEIQKDKEEDTGESGSKAEI